ncbi:antirestriction protein [Gluconobacter cerinus]|uniref:antirestriction protein n=1 Tax=Gluconobacter cerinus TaxID=38307 RepID=UPI001B8C2ACC|nr:antirestriction protein [Gluconobacter cerinus]
MENEITKKIVPNNRRMAFLPKLFGKQFVQGEGLVFDLATKMCPTLDASYWEFYELSNGGMFMAPTVTDNDQLYDCENVENYFEGKMTAEAVAVGVNLMVLSMLSFRDSSIAEHYHLLRDYIDMLPEGSRKAVWRMID